MSVRALVAAALLLATAPAGAASFRDRLPEDEIVYFLLPDRFDNGDTANDQGGLEGGKLVTGFDPADKGFYHGGDLKGLTRRLDYIQGLGATAIWVGPVFRNRAVQGAPGRESAGYHGYWITDFTHVDPHLGTDADFAALVAAAHARGMKVYMDIIANHTANVIKYRECPEAPCPYRSRADYPGQAYTPYVPAADAHLKVPAWLNDPVHYHNRGDSTFEGESITTGDFAGLDDLATEDPAVVAGMIEIYGGWIDRGIDGFRIDTAKHVNPEFWQAFVPAMLDRAKAQGIPNFHIFGEVFTGDIDPALQAEHTRVDRLPSVIDFAFRRAVSDAVNGGGSDGLVRLFDGDSLYEGGSAAALRLPTFLSNHDIGRLGHDVLTAHSDGTEALARVTLGYAMLLTLRGVPTIYSGDEQGFTGHGGDQDAREDMFGSKVASYNDNRLLGTARTTTSASFDPAHPLYRAIAALAKARSDTPALRRGRQIVRFASARPGLFAASRFDPNTGAEVLLAFNTSDKAVTANIEVALRSALFTALTGPCPAAAREPGSVAVTLPPFGYAICAAR